MSRAGKGATTHIVVVGNVVEDREPTGGWVPGGPSLYCARMAAALGARVTLVTGLAPGFGRGVLQGLELLSQPCAAAPRYANSYGHSGAREQLLLAEGEALDASALARGVRAEALLLAPAYHELGSFPAIPAPVVGVCLQGLLRETETGGRVVPTREPLPRVAPFARPGAFLFLSEEDTPGAPLLATRLAAHGAIVLLTRGRQGATMFEPGGEEHTLAPFPAHEVDPTGAGDCFAAAFVVRFAETGDLREASVFALAAGALAVEASGPARVPERARVEALLRGVPA